MTNLFNVSFLLSDLDRAAANLVTQGLSHNSRRTYSHAVNKYIQFCIRFSLNPYSLDELMVLRFVSYLSTLGLSATTIKVYLSGIRAWLLSLGAPPPAIYSPRVVWAIKAVSRSQPPPIKATPISLQMILKIHNAISYTYDNFVAYVAMLLGYFCSLRAAEYCPNPRVAPPLSPQDITHVRARDPYFVLNIKSSKNRIHGFKVVLGCSGSEVCAYCSLRTLLAISPHPPSAPLFLFADGSPLSHSKFTFYLHTFLRAAGFSPLGFTPHSLRAGGVTDAAGLGAPEAAIKLMGRWASTAYQAYIRPSDQAQAGNARRLASGLGLHAHAHSPANLH